ncbi:MAG: Tim44 domain-containing protein [Rhodospirillaceae bacterium]|jgi:predicted lipid-binding transport protein (Tim44 family)|nr:Tim44 domain-containing protein [Rhodospirillaceae bacterium]MBT4940449.1 Tim44 domain-containing protein [Rhodospirillaceae bacterium]MBT5941483.1 Tim44 domain-containing protein [Rhodospirillaceae bacterium]MBT7957203.1 Tim44 domain-containing protein [Rhodospirillaceae bacterium]
MGEGFQFIDIILFAMIAAFLILRLRSVLGRHKDSGEPPQRNQPDQFSADPQSENGDNVISLPNQGVAENDDAEEEIEQEPETPLDIGINQIRNAAPDFDRTEFLVGARTAFEMIIQAFAEGDTVLLESLLNNEVYNNFLQAIRSREAENQTLENTLVRIVNGEMIEAYMADSVANVTVKIISEQVNVTRDAEGEVVDGDADHISEVTDIWTFARDTKSNDPNWQLVATRSLD